MEVCSVKAPQSHQKSNAKSRKSKLKPVTLTENVIAKKQNPETTPAPVPVPAKVKSKLRGFKGSLKKV